MTVKKAPKSIKFSKNQVRLKKGKSAKLKVKLSKGAASYQVTYSSNKKSVAAVTKAGKVTAKKKGTAVITVKTYNKKKAKIKIVVK